MIGNGSDNGLIVVAIMLDDASPVTMFFLNRERARAAYDKLVAKDRGEDLFEIEVADDFGLTMMVNRDHVLVITMQDPKMIGEAQGRLAIINARANAMANKKAMDDPALKLLTGAQSPFAIPRA